MKNILKQFEFGNEAGDDVDQHELATYFVEQSSFAQYTKKNKRFLVATAKKGVGKSALIQWIGYTVASNCPDALIIKCRGADLTRDSFGLSNQLESPNDYIKDWMIRICALINRELALLIGFAATDDTITLVESAELAGYKSKNLIGCLLSRFEKILGKSSPKKNTITDEISILKRVKNRQVWILIDDLDATFQNTTNENISLSTFFSACRYITQDMKDINFRVSMRSDVWPIVRRFDEAQDKMEQYVHEIVWEKSDFRKILHMRVVSQYKELGISLPGKFPNESNEEYEERTISQIFSKKMQWGKKEVFTYNIIYTLSYTRPRWAVQLCKLAQKNAVKRNSTIITRGDIDLVWGEYGRKRIADLVAEHKHQCKEVEELVNAFRGAHRLMQRDELLKLINNKIITHLNPHIEGQFASSSKEVANFMYRIGFIVARSEEGDIYHHYHFQEMPDLLSSRTSDDFNVKWEIHPCYREALDIKKINKYTRIKQGLHK